MNLEKPPPMGAAPGFGSVEERRAAAQRAEEERAAWRLQQLASQASPHNGPEDRIQVWEHLHGLDLPRASDHKLLRVIAAQTGLTVTQVLEEQRRRADRRAAE